MSFLSLPVLFIAVIGLTNIEGNPKQQIHAQPNGLITNQLPTMKPDNQRRNYLGAVVGHGHPKKKKKFITM
jgi:hypothetical protein